MKHPTGTRNGNSKLTEAKVREIRESAYYGESQRSLAYRFETSQSNISYIVTRLTWDDVQ